MKKTNRLLVSIVLACASLVARADADDDDGGVDWCIAPYSTTYTGSVLSADQGSTLGSLHVREARASRSSSSYVTITYTTSQGKKIYYKARGCSIPGPFTVTAEDDSDHKLSFVITWDYFVGTDEEGRQYLASRSGNIKNIVIDPKVALVGYHTLALEAINQTNASEVASLGYVAVSLNIKKTGKYSASVKMPNGWAFSAAGKMTSDSTNAYCQISKSRGAGGGRESVAFTVVFNNLSQAVDVKDVSDWISTSKKFPIDAKLEFVTGGSPMTATKAFAKFDKRILSDETLTLRTTKIASKTGLVTGSFYYYTVNKRGRLSRKTGKIVGVDVNGEVYGSAYATNLWSYPFEATAPEAEEDEAAE